MRTTPLASIAVCAVFASFVVDAVSQEVPPGPVAGERESSATEIGGDAQQANAELSGCMRCHEGIEWIRDPDSPMMRQIMELGRESGDPEGCTVCHGGDAHAGDKQIAHGGRFFPAPASPWVNEHTCGQCHQEHVRVQWTSLMMTEAGKIQGTQWSFGGPTGYKHRWGNYDVRNPENPNDRLGTSQYRDYMACLEAREPQVFVDEHEALPPAETDVRRIKADPQLAVFTYLRTECLRCHHAVRGRQVRGDFRGIGCASCHIPFSNEGLYEGGDPTIPQDETGHCLVHSIQSTREAKVTVHENTYSGIAVETCTTCHNRGKRIGVSYQGLMEIPYQSPFVGDGESQPGLHTKRYMAMQQDVHYEKGMLCQDCHTSIDVHSDGFLAAANLGAVEIECADCHGTPDRFPWELPIGFMDEYEEKPAEGPPRGTLDKLPEPLWQGTEYDPRDGFLLTARGNPYSNVVRDGDRVIVHTAGGKDLVLQPLKLIDREKKLSSAGEVAMKSCGRHMEEMECYACHSAWAPQCYGCHVKIDYSKQAESFDWLAAGHQHSVSTFAAARGEADFNTVVPGKVSEERSFTRWEDPPLGVNGEGRVSPIAPGCQPSITIIGEDAEAITLDRIFRSPPGTEGGGDEGQLCIDMSPLHPHTITKQARTCESCHTSEKALGYGIGGGRLTRSPGEEIKVDLETADKTILAENARTQFAAVAGLTDDWSRFVTEDGEQLQTVGHHFKLSRPLNNEERANMRRDGVCLSCHQEIPNKSLAVSLLHHIAEYSGQIPDSPESHDNLVHKNILLAAWIQAGTLIAAPISVAVFGVWFWRRRRRSLRQTAD